MYLCRYTYQMSSYVLVVSVVDHFTAIAYGSQLRTSTAAYYSPLQGLVDRNTKRFSPIP